MSSPSLDMTPSDSPGQRLTVAFSISQGARDHQEDACGHWSDPEGSCLFAVVADGAGGHGGGADASRAAIASAAAAWERHPVDPSPDPEAFLVRWMAEAHLAVNEASVKIQCSARAVVVACLTNGKRADWVHAGDCRLLRFQGGQLVERTRDDSVVQVLFERGDITEEEMGTHPDQSRLLQSLGGAEPPTPRQGSADLVEGDVLILCSDGFWEHLKQDELEKLAATPPPRRQQALDQAVAEAVSRAGAKADNTTALMIAAGGAEGGSGSKIRRALPWVLAAVAGSTVAWLWMGRPGDLKQLWKQVGQGGVPVDTPAGVPIPEAQRQSLPPVDQGADAPMTSSALPPAATVPGSEMEPDSPTPPTQESQ